MALGAQWAPVANQLVAGGSGPPADDVSVATVLFNSDVPLFPEKGPILWGGNGSNHRDLVGAVGSQVESCRTSSRAFGDRKSEGCGIGTRWTRRRPRPSTAAASAHNISVTHGGFPIGRASARWPRHVCLRLFTPRLRFAWVNSLSCASPIMGVRRTVVLADRGAVARSLDEGARARGSENALFTHRSRKDVAIALDTFSSGEFVRW